MNLEYVRSSFFVVSAVCLAIASPSGIADPDLSVSQDISPDLSSHDQARGAIRFIPKVWPGVPDHDHSRVIDASRSGSASIGDTPGLYVLVPRQIAVTTLNQPSLFWYLSQPTDHPVRISVNTANRVEPVLAFDLDASRIEGIQRVDLSKWSVNLQAGVEYEWVVTILINPDSPSKNIFAKSLLQRLENQSDLEQRYAAGDRRQKAAIAAEEGVWIDALAYISDLIDHRPDDPTLRRERADLLRQVDFDVTIQKINGRLEENIIFPAGSILGGANSPSDY